MKNKNVTREAGNATRSERDSRFSVKLAKMLSVYATIGASLYGTSAANEQGNMPPVPAVVIAENQHSKVTVGGQDIISGSDTFHLPGMRADFTKTDTVMVQDEGSWSQIYSLERRRVNLEHRVQDMMWARLFADDPDARKTANQGNEVRMAADDISEKMADGLTIDRVTLHGFASDEDDTTHVTGVPGAGLGVDSAKNVELAEHRADAVMDLLVEQLKTEFTDTEIASMNIVSSGGTESRDNDLNIALNALADSHQMSVNDMIVAYNRGRHGRFNAADLQVLDQLKDHRYVSIEIEASKMVELASLVYVDGEWREEAQQERVGSVVFIPILIPIIKFGKKKQPEPTTPAPVPQPRWQKPQRPPKVLGRAQPKHGTVGYNHKQPTALNQGTGRMNINRGGRQGA